MSHFFKNEAVEDYRIKSERMVIPFKIVHHATPASKTTSSDLPSALVLSTEGLTAAATAIDSGTSFTTPNDSNGVFGCLVYNLGTVKKLLHADCVNLSTGTMALTRVGASSTGVTASGNIAVSIDWNGDLSMTDLSANLVLDFIVSKA
jgi:hypothetical protein